MQQFLFYLKKFKIFFIKKYVSAFRPIMFLNSRSYSTFQKVYTHHGRKLDILRYFSVLALLSMQLSCGGNDYSIETLEEKLNDLKKEKARLQEQITKKSAIKKRLHDFENQDPKDFRTLGDALYHCLQTQEQDRYYSRQIIIDNTVYQDQRDEAIGYALHKVMHLPLQRASICLKKTLKNFRSILEEKELHAQDIDKMLHLYIVFAWLKASQEKNSNTLFQWEQILNAYYFSEPEISYYNFDQNIDFFLTYLADHGYKNDYQDVFVFIAQHFRLPDSSLKKMLKICRFCYGKGSTSGQKHQEKEETIIEKKREQIKKLSISILNYQKTKALLDNATPLPHHKPNYIFSPSPQRSSGYYSDSEEEDAPHFNGVYNYTKHGIADIKSDSASYGPLRFEREGVIQAVNNYLTQYETIALIKLEEDAKALLTDIQPATAQRHITILCVLLRQKDGRIKKFAFSNLHACYQYKDQNTSLKNNSSTDLLIEQIASLAHERDYHFILTQGSHAEGGLLQFLQERPTRYTHLIAMGCSRKHCILCSEMLQSFFNQKIDASELKTFSNWFYPKALKHFCSIHQCEPKSIEKSRTKNQTWGNQSEHEQIVDWQNRPWKKT